MTTKSWKNPPEMTIDPKKQYSATFRTDVGDIVVKLFADKTPKTVNNFVFLAKEGFYVAVKLNIAQGIGELLPLIFSIIFGYIFIKEYNRINNILNSDKVPNNMNENYGPMDEYNVTPLLIMSLIFTCILFILSLIFTISGIKHLIAPEWYAIEDIINLFK